MTRCARTLSVAIALLAAALVRPAAGLEAIEDLSAVTEKATELASKYGSRRVLVVFDIDNTLLTMEQDLGSDAWFGWQVDLLRSGGPAELAAAKDFSGLLAVQGLLYSVSDMRPTEEDVAAMIDELEGRGFPAMALTARGPSVRGATLRELEDAGIRFDHFPACEQPLCARRGRIGKGQVLATVRKVFDEDEIDSFGLQKPRAASVAEGVMMVAGQHKGAMLRMLLDSARAVQPLAVVFADDSLKNVRDMEEAFAGSPIEVAAFHYVRLEPEVRAFLTSPERQRAADAAWDRLSAALCQVLETWCRN